MKDIIVIPTYNENENIVLMLDALTKVLPDADVLICDDSSPDGTGQMVEEYSKSNPKVLLNSGPAKGGLAPAYIRGFKWALENGYQRIAQMDCDFSHDPNVVPVLFEALKDHDLAIGSRYVLGGGTVNWPWYRKVISRGGSFYARMILGENLNDFTGGFKAWKRETLLALDLDSIMSNGYAFSVEMNYRAICKGFKFIQIPIIFEDRKFGQTKMSKKIFLEAIVNVWKLRLNKKSFI